MTIARRKAFLTASLALERLTTDCLVLVVSLTISSCGAQKSKEPPGFHSPLVSTEWSPLAPRRTTQPSKESNGKEDKSESGEAQTQNPQGRCKDIRDQMVMQAESLLENKAERQGYGADDLDDILSRIDCDIRWKADQSLSGLVDLAKKRGAFRSDGKPRLGDIALFHNQVDANGNGAMDDWLTGCGVVVSKRGSRFDAVVRTGHAPRRIVASPDGPAVRDNDGDKLNSFLRTPHRSDPEDAVYLAGQLYAGHIDIEKLSAAKFDAKKR